MTSYLVKIGLLNVIGIEQDGTTFIIDKEVHQVVSGTYLVGMDGPHSIRFSIYQLRNSQSAFTPSD